MTHVTQSHHISQGFLQSVETALNIPAQKLAVGEGVDFSLKTSLRWRADLGPEHVIH